MHGGLIIRSTITILKVQNETDMKQSWGNERATFQYVVKMCCKPQASMFCFQNNRWRCIHYSQMIYLIKKVNSSLLTPCCRTYSVVLELPLVKMNDVSAHTIEEVLRM